MATIGQSPFAPLAAAIRAASGLETVSWHELSTMSTNWQVRRHGEPIETLGVTQQLLMFDAGPQSMVARWNERVLQREFAPVIEAMADYLWEA